MWRKVICMLDIDIHFDCNLSTCFFVCFFQQLVFLQRKAQGGWDIWKPKRGRGPYQKVNIVLSKYINIITIHWSYLYRASVVCFSSYYLFKVLFGSIDDVLNAMCRRVEVEKQFNIQISRTNILERGLLQWQRFDNFFNSRYCASLD